MYLPDLKAACRSPAVTRAKGPVAFIIVEDAVEVESTIDHHQNIGFRTLILATPPGLGLDRDDVVRFDHPTREESTTETLVTAIASALPRGTWLYYGYNAEYLFYPMSETRSVGEMLAFHAEERRSAMLTYVVDLYTEAFVADALAPADAMIDRTGYYALARTTPDGEPLDRQIDVYGGLKWRFEEHVPEARRRIDRISLVQTAPGLRLRADHTWSDEELNTYACPWHNNLTAAVASFRTAKALATNPSSRDAIQSLAWHNSTRFDWSSQQLMDLGLMEPGQWF